MIRKIFNTPGPRLNVRVDDDGLDTRPIIETLCRGWIFRTKGDIERMSPRAPWGKFFPHGEAA